MKGLIKRALEDRRKGPQYPGHYAEGTSLPTIGTSLRPGGPESWNQPGL